MEKCRHRQLLFAVKSRVHRSLVLAFVLFSLPASALPWCGLLLNPSQREAVEQIVHTLGTYTFDADLSDPKQFPTQLLEGDQTGYQLFLSDGFDWPLAVKLPDDQNNLWKTLNARQKIYFLTLLQEIFRDNEYNDSLSESKILDTITQKLGLTWDEVNKNESQLMDQQYEKYKPWITKRLSPTKQKVVATLMMILLSPRFAFETRFRVLHETLDQLPEVIQQEIRGISARRVFELAYDRQNCVGACRQGSSILAAILLEIGVPINEVKLKCGAFIVPFTGHEWTQVKVGRIWFSIDPTPVGLAKLPKFERSAMTLVGNTSNLFLFLAYPWLRKIGLKNGIRPIWAIKEKPNQALLE